MALKQFFPGGVSGGTQEAVPTWQIDKYGNATFDGIMHVGDIIIAGGGTLGITLDNNEFLSGLTTTSLVKSLIGVNGSNVIAIDANAVGVTMAGTLGVTGLATFSAGAAITGAATVSTALGVGSNPATISPGLNLTNNVGIFSKSSTGGNLTFGKIDGSNILAFGDANVVGFQVTVKTSGLALNIGATQIRLNDEGNDVDFTVESDTNANAFVLDAGLFNGVGGIGIGFAANSGGYIHLNNPAMTAAGSTSFGKIWINNSGGAVTIPAGTTAVGATLRLEEPNFTAIGTLTLGATVYISGAPTEGTTNAALYVASGAVFLNLPTSAGVTGSLWANSGVVTVA
jgi:hypothetical protein